MPKLAFQPKRHGYHFDNDFTNRVLPGVVSGVQTGGLCGGMSMSALDYWRSGTPVPTHGLGELPADPVSGNAHLPTEGSRLRTYIFDRQMNSLLTSLMFSRWVVSPKHGPESFHDWAMNSEFEIIRRQIMLGRPALLGLWSMEGPTSGHQVLCYGFELNPKKLYIYDPNRHDQECELLPVSPAIGVQARLSATGAVYKTYRGYFFTDVYNWNESPPYTPPYKDLVVWEGMTLEPGGNANVGGRLTSSLVIRNVGEYPAKFRNLFVWVRGPSGENLDGLLGGAEPGVTRLNPGEQRLITRTAPNFGATPGRYTIGASYLSTEGEWINIPPGNAGAVAQATIDLWRPKAQVVDQTIDVPEAASDIPTGIQLRPGDEFDLTGSGTIWAGVWFTGVNGPEGWTNRIETNPASPYHDKPDARPFSLVGRFGNEPFFYIGQGTGRKAYPLTVGTQLFLRTNDNTPGNGSGVFQCRIQVWR
jgi:hypothetical protein